MVTQATAQSCRLPCSPKRQNSGGNTGVCDYAGEEHSSCMHVSLEQPAPVDDVPDVNAQPSNCTTSQSSCMAMYLLEWGLCVSKRPK